MVEARRISRREFLGEAAVVAGSVALPGIMGACEKHDEYVLLEATVKKKTYEPSSEDSKKAELSFIVTGDFKGEKTIIVDNHRGLYNDEIKELNRLFKGEGDKLAIVRGRPGVSYITERDVKGRTIKVGHEHIQKL
ncbi:MAG: twin-arginine translocation signal domain-containing protein [Candidatus Altiarchaeota archaeon]